jgi:hypothetical protein
MAWDKLNFRNWNEKFLVEISNSEYKLDTDRFPGDQLTVNRGYLMRKMFVTALAASLVLSLVVSCTHLRSGTPVKASFDLPAKTSAPSEEQSWACRYIPGVRLISNLFPEPSEARVKWDDWYKKRSDHWGPSAVNGIP